MGLIPLPIMKRRGKQESGDGEEGESGRKGAGPKFDLGSEMDSEMDCERSPVPKLVTLPIPFNFPRDATVVWLPPGKIDNKIVTKPNHIVPQQERVDSCLKWEAEITEQDPVLADLFDYIRCTLCQGVVLPIGDTPYITCSCGYVAHPRCELKKRPADMYQCVLCKKREYTTSATSRAQLRFHLHDKEVPCEQCGIFFVSRPKSNLSSVQLVRVLFQFIVVGPNNSHPVTVPSH